MTVKEKTGRDDLMLNVQCVDEVDFIRLFLVKQKKIFIFAIKS